MAEEAISFCESLQRFRDTAARELPAWEGHCTELVVRLVLAMPSLQHLRYAAREWKSGE